MNNDTLIQQAIELLAGARHVVALTGAGISTPSGIPDYRSPKAGLWEQADDMLEVASIYGFRHRPEAFYEWLGPLLRVIYAARPNPAHIALAQLESAGRLEALITQNIDLLHSRAGSRNVLEVHGHLREIVCLACHFTQPAAPALDEYLSSGRIPHCRRCHYVMKPSVVLFGELLPYGVMRAAQAHARTADVVLVAGSSLEVAPAGDLPALSRAGGGRLIIVNYMPTHLDDEADVVIRGDVADVLPRLAAALVPPPAFLDPPANQQYNASWGA